MFVLSFYRQKHDTIIWKQFNDYRGVSHYVSSTLPQDGATLAHVKSSIRKVQMCLPSTHHVTLTFNVCKKITKAIPHLIIVIVFITKATFTTMHASTTKLRVSIIVIFIYSALLEL